jgi:peroxiredoxin
MADVTQTGISIGERAQEFDLPDTEGARHRLEDVDGATATVIVFTCNHCPYALAWHERLVAVGRDYADRGVRFLAINSNDAQRYPADSYEAMQERVRKEQWPFPYLHDESQEVARAFGAKVTPDVFVLDRDLRLRYRGAPDTDYGDPSQNASWLREALDEVVAGREPTRPETEPVGCSVKWKP